MNGVELLEVVDEAGESRFDETARLKRQELVGSALVGKFGLVYRREVAVEDFPVLDVLGLFGLEDLADFLSEL